MNKQCQFSIILLLILLFPCLLHLCVVEVNATPPEFTPGEIIIRLTPKAVVELQSLKSKSKIFAFFAEHKVKSFKPVFSGVNESPNHNTKLQRTYLVSFSLLAKLTTLMTAFKKSELIEAVSLNYLRPTLSDKIVPNDPKYEEQWSLPLMRLPQAWAIEKGDKNVVIAIVDSGIDYRHGDLSEKIWINQDEIPDNGIDDDENGFIDDIHGWDFTDAPNLQAEGDFTEGDNEPIDESGHGTHVAGIAGAMPNNGIGIAGVAWNCPLMAVRAGLSLGGGSRMQDDDSAAAIVYAADNGANVINMSWGSAQQSFVIRDAIEYAHARGAVLIGAAGNSNESESIYPAAYRKVISVTSTNQHQGRFYSSNFGASVDLGAPGNGIISTQIDNEFRILTGTSMAASHVAGVAALMLSKRPALSHEEIRQILINTADTVFDIDSIEPEPKLVGAGTVNAEKALLASSVLHARIISPQTNSGGYSSIDFFGTAGGYKFESWQLFYGNSTTPTTYLPITVPENLQKTSEQLYVWDITDMPEGIYTVRLVVTGRDNYQTHDQVVITIDRTQPEIYSVTATETLYKDVSNTIITWATDDITQGTFYYRLHGQVLRFAPIEESRLGKEHYFSFGLETGKYQFYIEAQNTVGLKSVDDNNGKYYEIEVVGTSISPHGFVETNLISSPLQIANITSDFDKDGLTEIIGKPISDVNDIEQTGLNVPLIYERSPTGEYNMVYSLSDIESVEISDQVVDFNSLLPWTVDDTDNDGLLEILVSDKARTYLIESLTSDGYPTKVIWETPFLSGGKIFDFDGDGKKEIVGVDNNNNRILIFENIGNNLYGRTTELVNETEGNNIYSKDIVIDDFNSDGVFDLVVGDSEGVLFIYTVTANDHFRVSWQIQLDVDEVLHLSSGDLTGDGVPEIVVGGITSLPDVPSVSPIWKYQVFSFESHKYITIWEQTIAPYRINGNSIRVVDLDRDGVNELVIIAYPNLYVMKSNGTTFKPIYHQEINETPTVLSADLNNNGYHELIVNTEHGLSMIESAFAVDKNSVDNLRPWNVAATPVASEIVEITWDAANQTDPISVFTVYRAIGSKSEEPHKSMYEEIAQNLDSTTYLDKTVERDKTYWYTITATEKIGQETERSKAISVTPRLVPKIISATFQYPNWIVITYDRQMSSTIRNESRYLLRKPNQLEGIRPIASIRDRMGTRALLVFDTEKLNTLIDIDTDRYEIVVSNVADIDNNQIIAAESIVEIKREITKNALQDFSKLRVFPNPVRPGISDRGAITFAGVPIGTRITVYTQRGELLEKINVTEGDGNSKEWWLTNGSIGDIATGIYIYLLEYESQRKVGKFAVIK